MGHEHSSVKIQRALQLHECGQLDEARLIYQEIIKENQIKENEYSNKNFHAKEIDWPRVIPYIGLHIGLVFIFFVG